MSQKRGHGEGTTRFNSDRGYWEARFTYTDPKTGEKKRKKFTGKKQGEALKKGREWLKSLDNGMLPDADKITLWHWLDRWLNDYVRPKVRIKSFEKYESCLRCYIKPYLGDTIITKIKSPDVQKVFNQLLTEGGRGKTPLSSTTVRITRRYLTMAFEQAVKAGLLSKNIVKDTEPPALTKKQINPLTPEQVANLLQILDYEADSATTNKILKESTRIAILLAINSGMRLGEVFGLKWDAVDLDKGIIFVKQSLVSTNKGQIFQNPKTAKSQRKIPIPISATLALKKYKEWQEWYKNYLGDKYDNLNLVIVNQFGRARDIGKFTNITFKEVLKKATIDKKFTFHDLRHTHASLLLLKGVHPKIVQERLGHSTIQMTLDTYSHLLPDMQNTAVLALDDLLPSKNNGGKSTEEKSTDKLQPAISENLQNKDTE